ncbi:MAG: hypothetical protein LBQ68_08895 [Clostridiales bacterium]|jgi:transposase|nr:hypothetical protein [Clostridiales bacterium]
MRDLQEREKALRLYFEEGHTYQYVSKVLEVPLDTVKSWCLRYRKKMGIPQRNGAGKPKATVNRDYIHEIKIPNQTSDQERIARLEMEVELLRNFLILTERG